MSDSFDSKIQDILQKATKLAVSRSVLTSASLLNSNQKKYIDLLSTLVSATGVVVDGEAFGRSVLSSRFANHFSFGLAFGVDTKVLEIDWKGIAEASSSISVKTEPVEDDDSSCSRSAVLAKRQRLL